MRYLSLCSGIEAATVAWPDWTPVAFSEIEPFPSAVLAQHYPDVPNLGDMTKINGHDYKGKVDLIVGGTPCQAFSVAGLREGLADPRGNLALTFLRLVDEVQPEVFIWENVPGVLSSNKGRDFGSFVGAVAELGYRGAWRVLDAQYFGLAQRRKRVFFVGCSPESGRSPREILFERESLCGHPPPSREAREGVTLRTKSGTGVAHRLVAFGEYTTDETASTVKARDYKDATDLVTCALRMRSGCEGVGKGALVSEEQSLTLATANDQTVFVNNRQDPVSDVELAQDNGGAILKPIGLDEEQNAFVDGFGTLKARERGGGFEGSVMNSSRTVRRLTPTECERLQGFPDGYTDVPWRGKPGAPDGPRYKALGNSMAVPVMRWIGKRIT